MGIYGMPQRQGVIEKLPCSEQTEHRLTEPREMLFALRVSW